MARSKGGENGGGGKVEGAGRCGSDACGCVAHLVSEGSGGGEVAGPAGVGPLHAAGVEGSLKEANLKQLRRIEGQVRGIAAMIEDDRYCADIITQVSAVRESLYTVAGNLMRNHLKHCAAAAFRQEGAAREKMIDELVELARKLNR